MKLDDFAQAVTPNTQTKRDDLPPLVAYNGISLWAPQAVDEESGEVSIDMTAMRYLRHPIGKTGAGLNGAIDRILASFKKRKNAGYGELEGYVLVTFGVEPVATPKR